MKWLRRLLRGRGHHHHHDIDHEAVARQYHARLICAQRPIDPDDYIEQHQSGTYIGGLVQWHEGYAAWYEHCVKPLLDPGEPPPSASFPAPAPHR